MGIVRLSEVCGKTPPISRTLMAGTLIINRRSRSVEKKTGAQRDRRRVRVSPQQGLSVDGDRPATRSAGVPPQFHLAVRIAACCDH